MPIQRLDEKPSRNCTIQDITCDSDGKIANFISPHGTVSSLPVHPVKDGEHYYIGVFLAGAYQEILGDLHNLFGDTNAVHISVHRDRYEIDRVIDGETVADVLDYVAYNPKKLVRNVETWVSMSMQVSKITPEEGREFLSNYRSVAFMDTPISTRNDPASARCFLTLSYRGAPFHGWQVQPGAVSVQQVIEESLSKLTGHRVAVVGAGRTDAGVNARMMVAHADLPEKRSCRRRFVAWAQRSVRSRYRDTFADACASRRPCPLRRHVAHISLLCPRTQESIFPLARMAVR